MTVFSDERKAELIERANKGWSEALEGHPWNSVQQLWADIQSGQALWWCEENSDVVTRLHESGVVEIGPVSGDAEEMLNVTLPKIEEYARANSARLIYAQAGRLGWERPLKERGFTTAGVIMSKEVAGGPLVMLLDYDREHGVLDDAARKRLGECNDQILAIGSWGTFPRCLYLLSLEDSAFVAGVNQQFVAHRSAASAPGSIEAALQQLVADSAERIESLGLPKPPALRADGWLDYIVLLDKRCDTLDSAQRQRASEMLTVGAEIEDAPYVLGLVTQTLLIATGRASKQ